MVSAGEVVSESEAHGGDYRYAPIHVAGSRVSRLTTRIVNAFQTNPATRLFQVVAGGCNRSGPIAFSTSPRKKFHLGGDEPSARRKDALRSRGYQGRCAPLGGASRRSASLTAAPLRAVPHLSAEG